MPRYPRQYSKTGIYHIMLRGNERKDIFIDKEDKGKFIKIVIKKKADEAFKLYAYCIMNNHLHLVIKEQKEPISRIVKKIATSYAYYFNKKHKRVGHLFQDRYKSETIEDEPYLLSVIRYVHNNPEKAGIAKKEKYKWSSYSNYIDILNHHTEIPEIKEILEIFSLNTKKALKEFIDYGNKYEEKNFLEMKETIESEIDEENVNEYINGYLKSRNLKKEELKKREHTKQKEDLIQQLKKRSNLSKRKIAILIGVNRETVRRVSKEPSP
ncbi:MAG: transposase [Nitrospira bacterium HGW-Nitrospira-1]|nr:MAG: transposase [Nitrospira bacterium HGW-Nitrospira-1]